MRAACGLKLAAALLLLLAAVLVRHPHPAAAADGAALDEGTIMRRLRRAANDAGLVKAGSNGTGWEESDPSYHCYWRHVTCDSKGKVMQM
jgi:hypothetical protein